MPSNNEQISFNVTKSIWILNHAVNGWQKEVNLVAWNGKKPKLDIREWNADKTKMRRGLTLTKGEVIELKRCLNSIDVDWLYDIQNNTAAVQTGPGPAGAILSSQKKAVDEESTEEINEEESERLPESDKEAEVAAATEASSPEAAEDAAEPGDSDEELEDLDDDEAAVL